MIRTYHTVFDIFQISHISCFCLCSAFVTFFPSQSSFMQVRRRQVLLSALFQDGRKVDVHSYATAGKPKFQISESSIQDWKRCRDQKSS